ncbi:MAG TPA: 3-deoxy-8-phosphooctulonate synthase [Anaerohalosphaeraceae bacterium]|nr:3-deoxy-8-phosphooctulonate synthase [Anaerohalosphaeraceae bacterium]
MQNRTIYQIGPASIELGKTFFIITGPCVIESESLCLDVADALLQIQKRTQIPFVFKASFDKANRTSIESFRGPGLEKGLEVLEKVRRKTGLPVLTDIHEPSQVLPAAQVVDCLQIPAFLCRQTDLLVACAKSGKPVNVKKGQFVSPEEMKNAVQKIRAAGGQQIFLTERGTFFGYNRLVNDMTAIPAMQNLGCPVIFDATHSTQRPGGLGTASAGRRDLAPVLARAATAAGADGLFMEVHPTPEKALCDADCMLPLDQVEALVKTCYGIFQIVRQP